MVYYTPFHVEVILFLLDSKCTVPHGAVFLLIGYNRVDDPRYGKPMTIIGASLCPGSFDYSRTGVRASGGMAGTSKR